MSSNQKITKKELNKILSEIDREFNLAMAKLSRLHQKKLDLVKKSIEKKDKDRLEKLRKDILKI